MQACTCIAREQRKALAIAIAIVIAIAIAISFVIGFHNMKAIGLLLGFSTP